MDQIFTIKSSLLGLATSAVMLASCSSNKATESENAVKISNPIIFTG